MSMVTSCTHVLSRAAPQAKLPPGALQSGHAFGIGPFALVHPKFPPMAGDRWRIMEDEEYVKLWFHVGDNVSKEKLEVRVEHDDVLLVRSKIAVGEPASWLDVRLLVPDGYDHKGKVTAELTFGSLLVTIGKIKPDPEKIKIIPISEKETDPTKPS